MNVFSSVFSSLSADHTQFKPVLEHISSGKSKLIMGGSKYQEEVSQYKKYNGLLAEMRRSRKLVVASDDKVNKLEEEILKQFPSKQHPTFNDRHIVALCYVANARLVCTKDKPLEAYLQRSEFYNKGKHKPKIYNERSRPDTLPDGSFKPKCALC